MGTIVLIEREPGLSATFRLLLEGAGHSVHAESNGADGIQRCRDINPELVISHLTGGKGAVWHSGFIRMLRTELPDTTIVTLSGSADSRVGEELRAAGADRHIELPIPSLSFIKVIEDTLILNKSAADRTPLGISEKPAGKKSDSTIPPKSRS